MSRRLGLVVGGLVVLVAGVAHAQVNQINPRVLIMVDTSGSMTEHFTDTSSTGGDGSWWFSDENMTRSRSSGNDQIYAGFSLPANSCPATQFDGVNSRIAGAKQAVTNVVNGSGDIDWGLMRYSSAAACATSQGSGAGTGTTCTSDNVCPVGQFCIGGVCSLDKNLCYNYWYGPDANGETAGYGATRKGSTGGACTNNTNGGNGDAIDYAGSCGTNNGAGAAACTSPQICYSDGDCNGGTAGSCVALTGSAAKACKCGSGGATCDGTNYTCAADKYCRYAKSCRSPGGDILVNPATQPSAAVLPWVDGVEVLPGGHGPDGSTTTNPELRAVGGTPLAGAARAATTWYNNSVATDPQKACRPYVLVQMTDGFDSCDLDTTNGPAAAAGAFVAATVPGVPAKPLNKVYVVGLAFGGNPSTNLDLIAAAGGTGKARLANSQQDIEAALADIVASSVLVEKCNHIDDNCNGQCDENFPGVAVTNPAPDGSSCSNPHSAAGCDNGYPSNTHCYAAGAYVCSQDQLSQVCAAQVCTGGISGALSSPSANVMRVSNATNLTSSMVGQLLVVNGAMQATDNGAFIISAVGANTVDVTNTGFVADASKVSYGVPTMQGATTAIAVAAVAGVNYETLTVGSTTGVNTGDTVYVVGATPATYNGKFTVTSVTATTIVFKANAGAPIGTATVQGLWADSQLCPGIEVCNGVDDDCNGIIDDCNGGGAGSCCTSNCPACAKPPYIETCNNCDDDCDGIIDNHLVDTGLACGNSVGDCNGGVTVCCSNDPNASACMMDHVNDKIWCQGNNPGYPVSGPDKCDGTDDNCNGQSNDGPPQICYMDNAGHSLPPAKDGVGVCHHGIDVCQTHPLCGTLPLGTNGCVAGTCPVGWPAGKTCPNPTSTYDNSCPGLVVPSPEFCDGLDNDCNGCVDDNVQDAWVNQDCCPTGNLADCDNTSTVTPTGTVTGTRCHRGKWQCAQPGMCQPGAKTCVGGVAKTVETCNMIDDDCDGVVDDLPGRGTACTGPGIYTQGTCKAINDCVYPPNPNASPQLVCVQTVGPMPEVCNGMDDNCNGLIDDTQPPLAPASGMLPGVGMVCDQPMPPANQPPCKPGSTVCQNGMLVCVGAVHPMPDQCNGISTDCTGQPNTNGNCPSGFQCYQGNCVEPCQGGEFPCPGGYTCNTKTNQCDVNGVHSGCCVPDACATTTCPAGFLCQLDANGNAMCVDPCLSVTCPSGYECKLGTCVDSSCRTQGCPDGQVCVNDGTMFVCQPDPCASVTCGANQFCDNGVCVGSCAGPCPSGQYCNKGQCVPDPCAHVPCVEGQVCQVVDGVGMCVENQCQIGCDIGQACCGGQCIADPCANLHCPEDTHCSLTPDCSGTCETNPASPKVEVVGAGGGGFGCAVGGHGDAPASSLAWLLLVAGALLRRRRAAEVRK